MHKPEQERLLLTFDEAVGFVGRYKFMAVAYVPPGEGTNGTEGDGVLYRIVYLEEAQALEVGLEKGVVIASFTGSFASKQGKGGCYKIKNAPQRASELNYQVTRFNAFHYFHYQEVSLRIQLKILFRSSVEEAFQVQACRRCDWVLFKTGNPEKCFYCKK